MLLLGDIGAALSPPIFQHTPFTDFVGFLETGAHGDGWYSLRRFYRRKNDFSKGGK